MRQLSRFYFIKGVKQMIKGYKTQLNNINKFFNDKIRNAKKASKVWVGRYLVENPTDHQRATAIKDIEKTRAKYLAKLEAANNAEKLTNIRIDVNWHKSSTWGHNPTAEVWTSGGFYNTGRASGCGYDKESAAVDEALSGSPSLQRFLIENAAKIKNAYGLSTYAGLIQLNISGKGMSELLRIFKSVKGWEICEMHGRSFDGYKIYKK